MLIFLKIWLGSLSVTTNSCSKLLSLRSHAGEPAALRKAKSHLMHGNFMETDQMQKVCFHCIPKNVLHAFGWLSQAVIDQAIFIITRTQPKDARFKRSHHIKQNKRSLYLCQKTKTTNKTKQTTLVNLRDGSLILYSITI